MFDPTMYLPNSHDALQEPGHRWLRCQYLLEHRRSPTPKDDTLTEMTCAFVRDWQRCRSAAEREQLARALPALAEAVRFHREAPSLRRAELEARLLAGQDDDSIAGRCGLSPKAVHVFHELCFDVRSHLQAECYILGLALGPKLHHGLRADDYEILLKLAGYTRGASAVDQLLAYFADPSICPEFLTHLDDAALALATTRKLLTPSRSPLDIATRLEGERSRLRLREMPVEAGVPVAN